MCGPCVTSFPVRMCARISKINRHVINLRFFGEGGGGTDSPRPTGFVYIPNPPKREPGLSCFTKTATSTTTTTTQKLFPEHPLVFLKSATWHKHKTYTNSWLALLPLPGGPPGPSYLYYVQLVPSFVWLCPSGLSHVELRVLRLGCCARRRYPRWSVAVGGGEWYRFQTKKSMGGQTKQSILMTTNRVWTELKVFWHHSYVFGFIEGIFLRMNPSAPLYARIMDDVIQKVWHTLSRAKLLFIAP
jgi:hypothetical protein